MYKTFLRKFELLSEEEEVDALQTYGRTCYCGYYPFRFFLNKKFRTINCAPVTILYGSNGSGKSTVLNVMAARLDLVRHSVFNGSAFFSAYAGACHFECDEIPGGSQILTSDDVFDYLINIRYLNNGIDLKREDLFEQWFDKRRASSNLNSIAEYEQWKEICDAKRKTQSKFVKERLMRNVDLRSNGESALKFFVDHITDNALYLLDEPENSLAIPLQKELAKYISASARHYNCQFIIATHSPILLSLNDALIYDLDATPVVTRRWTELENVRLLQEFFEEHRDKFARTDD